MKPELRVPQLMKFSVPAVPHVEPGQWVLSAKRLSPLGVCDPIARCPVRQRGGYQPQECASWWCRESSGSGSPCTNNNVWWDLMCYPRITSPVIHVWHARRRNCVDRTLNPMAPLSKCVGGASFSNVNRELKTTHIHQAWIWLEIHRLFLLKINYYNNVAVFPSFSH